jgi:hypothetical protein
MGDPGMNLMHRIAGIALAMFVAAAGAAPPSSAELKKLMADTERAFAAEAALRCGFYIIAYRTRRIDEMRLFIPPRKG